MHATEKTKGNTQLVCEMLFSFLAPKMCYFPVDESNKQRVLVYFGTGCTQTQDRILQHPQEGGCSANISACVPLWITWLK